MQNGRDSHRPRLRRVSLTTFIFVSAVACAGTRRGNGTDPFVGSWKMNVARSNVGGLVAKAKQVTLTIHREGPWVTKTVDFVNGDNTSREFIYRLKYDGKDYPGIPTAKDPNPNTMAAHFTGPKSLEQIEKHNGHVVARYQQSLSDDASTLTVHHVIVHESTGNVIRENIEVFERQ